MSTTPSCISLNGDISGNAITQRHQEFQPGRIPEFHFYYRPSISAVWYDTTLCFQAIVGEEPPNHKEGKARRKEWGRMDEGNCKTMYVVLT